MIKKNEMWSRREFVRFIGGVSTGIIFSASSKATTNDKASLPSVRATDEDAVVLIDGLNYNILISWGEQINTFGETFGFNNDYINYVLIDNNPDDCLMWVNHEQAVHGYFSTPDQPEKKTKEDVEKECRDVGGSILRLKKTAGKWRVIKNDKYNKRIDALTDIPLVSDRPILGKSSALGTFGNCAGGKTPWNTILSCEENYHHFIGEVDLSGKERVYTYAGISGWTRFFDMPPEHYGWVVEIDPFTGNARKHTSMGRFAHESATVVEAKNKHCVVYSGDDKANECLYKFIADKPGQLESGKLYVADAVNGRWLLLDVSKNPDLKDRFRDQLDMLIRCREAASLAGGTPLDRPEDIEVDPVSGAVFITLTKNAEANRPFGSILKIEEENNDPLSLTFNASNFLTGGEDTGFACPDNLAFDKKGNLWFTSDISSYQLNKRPYSSFKNNGLFFVPMSGPDAGMIFQLGSAPVQAEFTGICFSADGKSMFLSVQHPGEESKNKNRLDSHWPEGGDSLPRPSVIIIEGEFLNRYCV